MRTCGRGGAPAAAGCLALLLGSGASQPVPTAAPAAPFPAGRWFIPYVMMRPNTDLAQIYDASGIPYFTLAFVLDGGGCQAAWGGRTPLTAEAEFGPAIARLRDRGGDVIVSFGGAGGRELALGCQNAAALQAQYQAVIDKYNAAAFDLDIEGRSLPNAVSVDRRNAALAQLQKANPRLQVSYTLPVEANGLTPGGIDLLRSALAHGVRVAVVNLMTMDYGAQVDPYAMAEHAIDAANAAAAQMLDEGVRARLGIIPMIGLNDTQPQVFTLEDARRVVEWAQPNPIIARMSMWSVGRDEPCPGGAAMVTSSCSGVAQEPYQFSHILAAFH